MPTFFIMHKIDRSRDFGRRFITGHIGRDRFAAMGVEHLAQGDDRNDEHHRWMSTHRRTHIVVVERMRRHAIEHGRIQGGGALMPAQDETRASLTRHTGNPGWDPSCGFARPGKRDANRVNHRLLGPVNRFLGQIFVLQGQNAFGKLSSDAHADLLNEPMTAGTCLLDTDIIAGS